jgi:4-alpha-glucanotransferase
VVTSPGEQSDPADEAFRPIGPELARLAEAYGVAVAYWDQSGRHVDVDARTVEAVLLSLGVDPSTPESIAAALASMHLGAWRRTLPPVFVAIEGDWSWIWVHLPHGTTAAVWVEQEDGERRELRQVDHLVAPQEVDGRLVGEATYEVPGDLPLGWHTLHAQTEDGEATAPLVMTPRRLDPPALDGGRQWGFMTQVYATRSRRSWGIGDLADLADLCSWSGTRLGADFVLVNPLHAATPVVPVTPSPYLPVSRRFFSPMYLRVEAIPEYAYLDARSRTRVESLAAPLREASLTADLLDRDTAWQAKAAALELVSGVPLTPGRRAAFDAYLAREGTGLRDFATWCALAEEHGADTREWPDALRDPESPAVTDARGRLADRVRFHCWLQWQLDGQLAATQQAATSAGMRSGIVHDLAVGVHPEGADAWSLQRVLAAGVSVGAPPDMYNQIGQNWSQPPWRPDALAEAGFAPYRDMLRTILRHAGGIRVDHVLGLFRMWWVPEGMPANRGTFVRFDHRALVGILALEAHRAGAFVIGEDLGTVEPWVQEVLRDRGILGTSILWFERWESGLLRRPEDWRAGVLASATVHDLPPTAGYLEHEHVRIRADLGLLARSREEEDAAADREWQEWRDVMVEYGVLDPDREADLQERVLALHRMVGRSPAQLIGVALTDAVGDRRAQNQPGTDQEYPNWKMPLTDGAGHAVLLEDLPALPFIPRLVAALGE